MSAALVTALVRAAWTARNARDVAMEASSACSSKHKPMQQRATPSATRCCTSARHSLEPELLQVLLDAAASVNAALRTLDSTRLSKQRPSPDSPDVVQSHHA